MHYAEYTRAAKAPTRLVSLVFQRYVFARDARAFVHYCELGDAITATDNRRLLIIEFFTL